MKYDSWEDMINAQALAFSALCAQNERLNELAAKADEGYDFMSKAEQAEYTALVDEVYNNPFFIQRCASEWAEFES